MGTRTPRNKRRRNLFCKELSFVGFEELTNAIRWTEEDDGEELRRDAVLKAKPEREKAEMPKDMAAMKCIYCRKRMEEEDIDPDECDKYMTIVQKYMHKLSE